MTNLSIVSPSPLASPMLACHLPGPIEKTSFVKMLLDKHKLSVRPTHKQWFNGIRISLHVFNTEKEVDYAAEAMLSELG